MGGSMGSFRTRLKQASLLWVEGFREACCLHRVVIYCRRSREVAIHTGQCFLLNGIIFLGSEEWASGSESSDERDSTASQNTAASDKTTDLEGLLSSPIEFLLPGGSEADKAIASQRKKWKGAGLGRIPVFVSADYLSMKVLSLFPMERRQQVHNQKTL
ncbi:protein EI24 [Sesamum angolense]|uniref:Protein EI24 n=1 Tax=Sesamum angolense TaxID=2727404 RepID=A0AAE1WZE4_9LAMI|nr:protein EI24 [Sesamum angolense]